jgi:hypothetical protein
LDLKLPDGSGRDFLQRLGANINKYRIIVLTAHEEQLAAESATEFDVFTYLPKAARLGQPLRFSVSQAFKDIERESLLDKNRAVNKIQDRINRDIPESGKIDDTYLAMRSVLEEINDSVRCLVGAYTSHIRVYELRKGDYHLAAFAGPNSALQEIFKKPKRTPEPFSGLIAGEKKPRNFVDLQNDLKFQDLKHQSLVEIKELGDETLLTVAEEYFTTVKSAFIAPITTSLFADEIDAVFNVSADSIDFFSEDKQEGHRSHNKSLAKSAEAGVAPGLSRH